MKSLLEEVRCGSLSRRAFVRTLVKLGVAAPVAHQVLVTAGLAQTAPRESPWTPARRGGGGALRTLWWQAATLLNPHLTVGLKDTDGARLCYEAAARAGIEVELKSVVASAYFSSDPANPDTASHFYADLQMYAIVMGAPDPEGLMRQFTSAEVATRANQWQRRNVARFRSDEYDRLFRAAEVEMDPSKRAALFIRMNDLLVQQAVVVPIVWRGQSAAVSHRLKDVILSGWAPDFCRLAWWHT